MQPRAACRRTRAPQRLGAIAGLAPPLRRAERLHRRDSVATAALSCFAVTRASPRC
jgi:hypothetical protein